MARAFAASKVASGPKSLGTENEGKLIKTHDLCGPIDHALMSSFLFVKPTGTALNEAAGKWAQAEMDRAVYEWRRQMRGDAPIEGRQGHHRG